MIIIDGQLCPWKDISSPAPRKEKKKKMKTKPSHHFQVGYIHSRGGARGGRGHHWPKLGHPFGHPTQNCSFCPFFFLTRNTFIKTRNRRISLWPHKTGDFSYAHFSLASAPGAGQTSVERNRNQMSFSRTTVNCGLMRCCISKTNFPVLSAVTVLAAHTLQLYANIRRTLFILIINNARKKLWAYKVLSSVKSWNKSKRQFVHSCMYSITLKNVSQMHV